MDWRKAKNFFEWLQIAQFIGTCVFALASWRVLRSLLPYILHIPAEWVSIIALFAVSIVLFSLVWVQRKSIAKMQSVQNTAPPPPPAGFNASEFVKGAYTSALLPEIEDSIRTGAEQTGARNREDFYLKLGAIGVLRFSYEVIWAYIFKSQHLMLSELNRGTLPISEVKSFYDKAALEHPSVYATLSFDQWLIYLFTNKLVLRHPSDMFEITIRGRDFLKYLVHYGYTPNQRNY